MEISTNRSPRPATRLAIPAWLGCLLVAGLWLLARPYIGVRHDGVLYLGQVLRQLQPAPLSQDLFFAFGSQDSFSVFSKLVALVHSHFGLTTTQVLMLCACHSALLVAVFMLLRPLPSPRDRWLAMAAVATLSHVYGGMGLLAFAETFVTARTLAEPLAVAALVALTRQRTVLAAGFAVCAALAHPLMATVVWVTGWLWLCQTNPRWWAASALLVVPLGLGLVGVAPFSGLLQSFDAAWGAEVLATNPIVYISRWSGAHWMLIAFDWALLASALRVLPLPLAALCRPALWAVMGLTGISLLGADLLHNVLITSLQLWRGQWLTHILALACLPTVLLHLWRLRRRGQAAALAVALTALATYGQWEMAWAFGLWAALLLTILVRRMTLSNAAQIAIVAATALALAGLSIALAARTAAALAQRDVPLDIPTLAWMALNLPTISLPLAASVLWSWQRGRWMAFGAVATVALMTVAGIAHWDRRSPWTAYIESAPFGQHPFSARIPINAEVLWPRELMATWALLGRRSYFSDAQGGGVVFSRETATEFTRRKAAMAPLALQREICVILGGLNDSKTTENECIAAPQLIAELCSVRDGPDFLVLPYELPRGLIETWTFNAPHQSDRTLYLYDCQALR